MCLVGHDNIHHLGYHFGIVGSSIHVIDLNQLRELPSGQVIFIDKILINEITSGTCVT